MFNQKNSKTICVGQSQEKRLHWRGSKLMKTLMEVENCIFTGPGQNSNNTINIEEQHCARKSTSETVETSPDSNSTLFNVSDLDC